LGSTFTRLLTRWGHEPHLIPSGSEALEKALALTPDIALIDIGLPGRDGFSVAATLRRAPKLSATRLIAISGHGSEAERTRARKAGFHEFLLKPVDPAFLRRLLEV